MISEAAGQESSARTSSRRLSEKCGIGWVKATRRGPRAMAKELLLLVIQTVKANACLSQLHARAAVKAGATLAQVLQVIQYVELTGMVKWVMVGHDALTAAEADVPEAQRLTPPGTPGPDTSSDCRTFNTTCDGMATASSLPSGRSWRKSPPPFWMAISGCGRILSSLTRWGRCRKS